MVIVVVCRLQWELVMTMVHACLAKSSAMMLWIVPSLVVVTIFSVCPELSLVTLCSLSCDETLRSPSLAETCWASSFQILLVLSLLLGPLVPLPWAVVLLLVSCLVVLVVHGSWVDLFVC